MKRLVVLLREPQLPPMFFDVAKWGVASSEFYYAEDAQGNLLASFPVAAVAAIYEDPCRVL